MVELRVSAALAADTGAAEGCAAERSKNHDRRVSAWRDF